MKNKILIMIGTAILTVIIFSISTLLQKKLINYEPSINCLILDATVAANQKVREEMFVTRSVPASVISTAQAVTSFSEIEGLYLKDNVYKGQIAMKNQFDTKENLSIYEIENGKEKISIKIQSAENGISYAVKSNSVINLYATIRSDYVKDFLTTNERLSVGDEFDGYTVIKILDSVTVLASFNIDGVEIKDSSDGIVDTVLLAVTSEEAKQINLLREIATFNITGVDNQVLIDNSEKLDELTETTANNEL